MPADDAHVHFASGLLVRVRHMLLPIGVAPAIAVAGSMAVLTRLPAILELFDGVVVIACAAGLDAHGRRLDRRSSRLRRWLAPTYAIALLLLSVVVFASVLSGRR